MSVVVIPERESMLTQFVRVDVGGRAYTWSWRFEPPLQPGDQVRAPHPITGGTVTGTVIREVARLDMLRVVAVPAPTREEIQARRRLDEAAEDFS